MTLELVDVYKSYGDTLAVDGVSLKIAHGEVLALLGANGAGKTTLVNLMSGLLRPDKGVIVNSFPQQVAGIPGIGLAPQQLGIYPHLTVWQNLQFCGAYAGLRGKALINRSTDVADALGLSPLLRRRGQEMSGGEQRRLHTAIALLSDPPLLLLDEATAGADIEGRRDLLQVVKACASRGSAVVYSTHYLEEVEELDGDVAILDEGRLVVRGRLEEVKRQSGGSIVELYIDGNSPELPESVLVRARARLVDISIPGQIRITADDASLALAEVVQWLVSRKMMIRDVRVIEPSVEGAFIALTKKRYVSSGEIDND